ncbi:MAG: L-serine ammonia-lyase, iron-sulfur-dependent subunit beta [Aristaeellaceae bacterium]
MDLFDLIGPVMIGPSSSHTAGAARIGLTARMLLGEDVISADIGFHGSFAKTYHGHGTDRAIVGGLMGMQVDDPRIRNSLDLAAAQGLTLQFTPVNIRGAHPNTVRMTIVGASGQQLTMEAASVGGGNIEVHRLNGLNVTFSGKENTLIIHHKDTPGEIAAVTGVLARGSINIGNMSVYRRGAGADAMMVLELDGLLSEDMLSEVRAVKGIQSAIFLKRRSC